mmetsp:Transcript_16621/g.20713  ORF Transcript_16621/g.20713 Transcript_16621/m.20713 type:complete len:213 (+) Transcript_16621:67-705(+)|eukprot:CAMPEP_0172504064 /NCGR_PEP_ID=MMETSP1066-20121228/174961_1 /TAXON_ID=671091 /ORGANISM="Coscinodiscus wailesii, Strain CCMP2513" /LENGTH=212 /DNA_ID=CAMNT_0013280061 /DNA_START=65 /DNA_END=703 /DNA_ORIENTATION=+
MTNQRYSTIVAAIFVAARGTAGFYQPSLTVSPPRKLPQQLRETASDNIDSSSSSSIDPFESYAPGSSLAYKETSPGTGEPSTNGDVLTVAYKGRLFSNLRQFDKGDKFIFKAGGGNVMPGFDQGLAGAKLGAKRTIRIPPELAYGARGKGNVIPPNSDLEFDVEVVGLDRGFVGEVTLFGKERAIGMVGIIAVMGAIPALENAGILAGKGLF